MIRSIRGCLATLSRVCLPLLLIVSTVGSATAEEDSPQPMTPADLWAMQRLGSPALSPDGTRAVVTVTEFDSETNRSNGDLWLVATDGATEPRRLTWNEGRDGSARFSPDGKHIVFLSKRGDDAPAQLMLLSLTDGGEAEPLTDLPIAPSDPRWFPDGKRLIFAASTWPDLNDDWEAIASRIEERKQSKVTVKATESRLVRYWDHYLTDGRVTHLFTLDLATREITDLMKGSNRLLPFFGVAGSWDLSPDGREIAFTANSTDPPHRTLNFDIYTMPTSGGEPRNITRDNEAYDLNPRYSPDGRHLVFGRNSRPAVAPDFTRLARYDRERRSVGPLLPNWDRQPSGWEFTPDGSHLLFHATDAGRRNVYLFDMDGSEPTRLVLGGSTSAVRCGPRGLFIYLREQWDRPAELFVARAGENDTVEDTRRLTSFNDERLSRLDLGTMEDVTFAGADGDPVQMFVVLPPGFDPAKKSPLLHLVHGGPHGSWLDSFHYRWNMALFASRGHVVTAVNFHGSTGRGQAFAESILGNHAEKPFTDIMTATDVMLARGTIDGDRMAAAGGSYGGYLVSWILGHTERFSAIINHAGVYDLMAQFASDYTWGRPNNYGASPWEDPARIDLYSPSRFAKNFDTPTLILHGEKDYRVPYTQGLNLHQVLTGKGVPSRLVVFPDENHWVLKPQNAFVWWGEVFGWLERYAPPS